jgi:hypothetical protein
LYENDNEEVHLKHYRFLIELCKKELDDCFFKMDYKPSRPLQLSSQQVDMENAEQLRLESKHDAPQASASSSSIVEESCDMLNKNDTQDTRIRLPKVNVFLLLLLLSTTIFACVIDQLLWQPQADQVATSDEQLQLIHQYNVEMNILLQQLREEEDILLQTYNTALLVLRQRYRQKQSEFMNELLRSARNN